MKNKEKSFDYINFAYGIGAAIVIIGAMFKFLGWNHANEFFMVGLTVEAIVFTISAFEYKQRKDVEKLKKYKWENVFPELLEAGDGKVNSAELFAQIAQENAAHTSAMVKSLEYFNQSIEKLNTVTSQLADNVSSVSQHILAIEKSTNTFAAELDSLKDNVKLNSTHFNKLNGTINQYENNLQTLVRLRSIQPFYYKSLFQANKYRIQIAHR